MFSLLFSPCPSSPLPHKTGPAGDPRGTAAVWPSKCSFALSKAANSVAWLYPQQPWGDFCPAACSLTHTHTHTHAHTHPTYNTTGVTAPAPEERQEKSPSEQASLFRGGLSCCPPLPGLLTLIKEPGWVTEVSGNL